MDHDPRTVGTLKTVLSKARLVLLWERVWPIVFQMLLLVALFLATSWLGLWQSVPPFVRAVGLFAFAVAGFYLLFQLFQIRRPSYEDAIDRVEAVSGVDHRPLTATLDAPVGGSSNSSQGHALWQAHQKRIRDSLLRLKAGHPERKVEILDPFALRAVVLLLLFVGFNVAGPDRVLRLGDILDFSTPKPQVVTRLDAWVTPPAYTGRPPVFLTMENNLAEGERLRVPENSILTVRTVNSGAAVVTFDGLDAEPFAIAAQDEATPEASSDAAQSQTYEFTLSSSGDVAVELVDKNRRWSFDVIADRKPVVSFATNPEVQRSGALEVVAVLKDDYGVVRAHGEILPTDETFKALKSAEARPLYDPPEFPLSLNRGRVQDGAAKTVRSLVDHPWAGADVTMTLHAFDEAGQEGVSDALPFTLPLRQFSKPVARALIEQRRNLALDANYRGRLVNVLDALTIRPEQFGEDYAIVISLAAVRRALIDARDDDALRAVVDELWAIATALEDGTLSEAERNLRDALQALRDGIENNASQEELARLMEEARQAMREFMQALAEQAQNNEQTAENQQQPLDPSQVLRPEDLERMLDRIEDLAQTGSRDAAQQLLSELQQMMENLQANRNPQGNQGNSQAQQMLDELGEMIRRQQELMDQTFRQQNQQNRQGYQGQQQGRDPSGQQQGQQRGGQEPGQQPGQKPGQQPGRGLAEMLRDLQGGQQSLSERLQRFMEQMQQNGMNPNGQLGEAQRSMGQAAGELGEGDLPGAGERQNDALSQLRSGAQELANQMAGEGQGEGDHDLAQGDRRTDPLGRQERTRGSDFGDSVKVPDEIDTQRAREILDAIRRRLGEPLRPQIELDYLERLLRSE